MVSNWVGFLFFSFLPPPQFGFVFGSFKNLAFPKLPLSNRDCLSPAHRTDRLRHAVLRRGGRRSGCLLALFFVVVFKKSQTKITGGIKWGKGGGERRRGGVRDHFRHTMTNRYRTLKKQEVKKDLHFFSEKISTDTVSKI